MKKGIYRFLEHHVDWYNCGEHDLDNSFLLVKGEQGLVPEFNKWQDNHPDCVPVGVCEQRRDESPSMLYVAMVFEDEDGRRYFVHVPSYWIDEYKAFDDGPEAMREARERAFDEYNKAAAKDDAVQKDEPAATEHETPNPCIKTDPDENPPIHVLSPPEDPKDTIERLKSSGTAKRVYFKCDARKLLENAIKYIYEDSGGIDFGEAAGLQIVFRELETIARRAIELDDPGMHISMLRLGMYDTDDVDGAIDEMKKRLEKADVA